MYRRATWSTSLDPYSRSAPGRCVSRFSGGSSEQEGHRRPHVARGGPRPARDMDLQGALQVGDARSFPHDQGPEFSPAGKGKKALAEPGSVEVVSGSPVFAPVAQGPSGFGAGNGNPFAGYEGYCTWGA